MNFKTLMVFGVAMGATYKFLSSDEALRAQGFQAIQMDPSMQVRLFGRLTKTDDDARALLAAMPSQVLVVYAQNVENVLVKRLLTNEIYRR